MCYFCNMKEESAPLVKFPKFTEMILHEDENLIVVNKPAFLASLDEREGGGQCAAPGPEISSGCAGLPPAGQGNFRIAPAGQESGNLPADLH